ncbi:hypothetical protein [Nostoc sp. UHCC 0302]
MVKVAAVTSLCVSHNDNSLTERDVTLLKIEQINHKFLPKLSEYT